MRCAICKHGGTWPGHVTVTLERGQTTFVIKNVVAQVCENCGEAYLDEATTERLLKAAEVSVQAGVQVEVREFEAA